MHNKHKLLTISFCLVFTMGHGQKGADFPYKGGEDELLKEISIYLHAEASDTGRIYFVEIYYEKKKKEIASAIHGITEKEMISAYLISNFFEDRKHNWSKAFLKKTTVIIPLILPSAYIDTNSTTGVANLQLTGERLGATFQSKKCFLVKPIIVSKQDFHIDMEPPWEPRKQ